MNGRLPHVAVDAMGGDHAPHAIVAGALLARRDGLARVTLVGDRARIAPLLGGETVEIRHVEREIPMDAHGAAAARGSAGTSLGEAVEMVKEGAADACVSAGNSGAFLAVAVLRLRPIPGIARPAIAAALPGRHGPVVLCDAGANVDCRPEWLAQFGVMGAAYARAALQMADPRVGVLSVGEERTKGNAQSMEAARLLDAAPLRFTGNVEGKDIWTNEVDVVVCDGFVGNVVLKTSEGAGAFFRDTLRDAFTSSLLGKAGGLLAKGALDRMRSALSYETYGGAPLLGVRGCCIVAHGRSNPTAVRNAIAVAARSVSGGLVDAIRAGVAQPEAVR